MLSEKQNYIYRSLAEKPRIRLIRLIRLANGMSIYHCKLINDTIFMFGAHTNPAIAYMNWRSEMYRRGGNWATYLQLENKDV